MHTEMFADKASCIAAENLFPNGKAGQWHEPVMVDETDFAIAEQLVKAGMSIVRCRGKVPDGSIYDDEVTTKNLVRIAHWSRHGYNLGATTPDGLILHIDVDPRHGGDLKQLTHTYKLPATWACWSGGEAAEVNGKLQHGAHLFYRAPAGVQFHSDSTLLGDGISVLGPGLQGIIPPSIHPDTHDPYRWIKGCSPLERELADAPPDIIARLSESIQWPQVDVDLSDGEVTEKGIRVVLRELERSAQRVSRTPKGGRHNALVNQTAYLKGYVLTGFLNDEMVRAAMIDACEAFEGDPKYNEKHAHKTIDDVLLNKRGKCKPRWPECCLFPEA